jgi:hypothetical protein
VHPDADVRPVRERDVLARVVPPHFEAIRVRERRRVAVGGGDRDAHELAAADAGAHQLDPGGRVPVDDRGGRLEPQRLLDRVRQQPGLLQHERELVRVGEEVPDRVGDHALGRLDAAEQEHRGVGDDPFALQAAGLTGRGGEERGLGLPLERRADRGRQRRVGLRAGGAQRLAFRDLRDRPDDLLVPPEHGPHVGVLEAEGARDDRDRQRTRESAPQIRAAVGLDRVDQPLGLLRHLLREAGPHGGEAERAGEGVAMAAVVLAVEREHARTDDLAGGEPRVLDREGRRVAHHLQREVAPGDEPPVQRGQPGHGLSLAQQREQRVRIVLELRERSGGADREPPVRAACRAHPRTNPSPGASARGAP